MQILGFLVVYFDTAVVFVTNNFTFIQIGCGHTLKWHENSENF